MTLHILSISGGDDDFLCGYKAAARDAGILYKTYTKTGRVPPVDMAEMITKLEPIRLNRAWPGTPDA